MFQKRRSRSRKHLYGALVLLLLLAAMLPLGAFLAGILSGGGDQDDEQAPADRKAEASRLRITVLSALDRSPIEGARILVRGLTGGETDAETDPAGQATVEGLGAGPVQVKASWRGSGVTAWTDPSLEKEILLAVPPASPRGGRVRTEDGSPFEGALVHLLGPEGEVLASTQTDAQGRYELPDDPAGESVCVEPRIGAPAVARNGDLIVHEGALLEGRLMGTGEGGQLRIYGLLPSPGDDGTLPFRALWRVGKSGAFRGRLPEGAQAWGLYEGLPVRIEGGELVLPDRTPAHGLVRTGDGSPAAGATLLFRPLLENGFPVPLPAVVVRADAKGAFHAPGFARVAYSVEARAPGCATRIVPEVLPGAKPIEIRLDPGYSIGGIVIDTAGLPVPGAEIRALASPDAAGERPVAHERADEKGRFLVQGLGGEHARVRVEAPGCHPTTLEGVRGKTDLAVVLQRR
jgi:hypothetical protein